MKPFLHGKVSVKKWGGKEEDYQKIHDWFDQTKARSLLSLILRDRGFKVREFIDSAKGME